MIRNLRNRLRRKSDKQLRRDYLRHALRTETLEQRQFLAADSVPSLVNFATTEHTDLNISSQWAIGPLVETDPPTQFANDEVVLYVGEPAKTSRSAEEKFDFIGPETVEEYYLLPQNQNVEVLYAGFASYGLGSSVDRYDPADESKGRVSGVARYAKATLTDVRHTTPDGEAGDGDFSLWQTGSQGNPIVAMASWDDGVENPNADGLDVTDGISADDAMWIFAGGHAHYNFGFTQPGRYEIDLKLSAYIGDDNLSTPNESGYSESASTTLYFSVMSVGELQFDQSSYTVNESDGNASIDVVRVGGSDGRITATYATSDNTALEPSDYTATNGTLEFLDGETRKTITIPIIDDTQHEGDESFTVGLSATGPGTIDGYLKVIEEDDNGLLGSLTTTTVTIPANDTPPTISDIADQSIDENASTGALAFTVGDAETAPADLIVTATSSNPTLVPNDNIVLGGSGANRTVTITPVADLYGVATITLTVEDEDGLTATDTFELTVNAANEPPTISDVANQSIEQDTATGPISFTVGDAETSAAALTVSATSSNLTLVPNSSIVLGGSGANRTVSVTPAAGQMGNATITLTVTDGNGGTATDTFVLNVGPSNAPPTISDISDQTTDAGAMTGEISFTVGDTTTAAGALVVTATSSNVTVIPDANITLGGSGADRTISITPVPGRIGSTTITVTVTDEGGLQASDTFELVVTGTSLVPFGVPEVVGSGLDYAFEPELADINGDGHVDILTASYAADKVVWFENLGDGTYGPEQIVAAEAGYPWEAHVADLDADGDQDVIVGGYSDSGDLVWYENLGENFGPAQSIDTGLYGPFIRSADVDGDGKLDVLVARDFGGDIYWYRNEGDGVFGSANVIATGLSEATGFVVRDLNGDGRPEAITGEYGANQLAYFVNNGDGTFGTKQNVASTSGSSVFAADDLNGDGIDDLLVVGLDSLDIGFHAGQSDGTIGAFTALPSVSKPAAATTADFDQDGDFDVLIGSYGGAVYWLQNLGEGNFSDSIEITRDVGQVNGIATADIDGDGDPDVVAADLIRGEIVVLPNRLGEFATTILPPAARIYPAGQSVDLSVHFGYPVEVTGTPSVSLQVGGETVEATYVSGSGTTELLFRYMVVETDVDDDGIELVSTSIDLNGGSLVDPTGDPVDLTLPAVDLSGVLVNGSAPVVHSVERSSDNPTAAHDVTFQVTFSESVTGVDVADFGLTLNGVADASVTGVSGSGDEYFVTVSTGAGSGTIGLEVLETATITDTEANVIGEGFVGGEVFTLNRRPARQITNFFTQGHGDIGVGYSDGQWDLHAYVDDLYTEFAPDEVLIVGGPDSKVTAPSDTAYDFLGAEAGSEIYVLPQSNVPATIPDLGIGAGGINSDAMASYFNDDPRVDSTGAWVELQVVDVRLPEGGQFSLYSSGVEDPTVWIASSDGIDDQDAVFAFANSHGHYNWAFTKPGIYEIDLFASGFADQNGNGTYDEGVDRYTESGIVTYYFSIDPPEGPQPYTIPADVEAANVLVPFAMPEYHGGEFSTGSYGQVVGDFNDDGNVDLVVAGTGENALTYMQGNGDGTFQPEQLLNADSGVYSQGVTDVDYDGDGDTDVLVYEFNYATQREGASEGTITLYRNDGDANFTREVVFDGLIVGYRLDAGDLNGDGRVDVVYDANRYDFETRMSTIEKAVLLQQPDGTLGEKTVLTDVYSGELIMADVDGDGHLDIVSTGSVFDSTTFTSTAYLQIFAGNGDGTFDAPQDVSSNAGPNIHQVIDLTGDGLKDLLVYDRGEDSHVGYYPQQADGSFGERVTLTPGYLYSQLNMATDINGDGLPDIVSYGYSGGYKVVWSPNLGGGVFGDSILVSTNVSNGGLLVADVDNDSYPDIINAGSVSATRPAPISVFINKTGEDPMVLVPPAARTRIGGDPIDLQVYFGFPIEVTGTPRIALQVGDNTVYADYVSGSGTPFLDFRYTVAETDIDLDGVQLASNLIDLNSGTLTDPIGGEAVLEFPNVTFEGVFVNAVGPLVQMVSRVDSTPTEEETVRFTVQFSEDVTDVDVSDFSVRMTEGDLAGATVDSVTAISASEYEVTVSTGTGSGALGLTVNDSASIHDTESHVLARGYQGGEVYTVRQQPIGDVDTYYTNGHADYRPTYENGEFTYIINPDDSLLPEPTYPSNAVVTYVDSTAVVTRGDGDNYDFLGVAAGDPIYVSDSSGSVATVPYLGWEGGSLPRDVFADYRPTGDSRVTSSSLREYVKVQMVGFRSSSDGDFSMYSGSTPTVWMTTSDGITISDDATSDAFWLYPGAHLHRNVAFTKPGTYEIDVVVSGYLDSNASDSLDATDVYVESGIHTLVFHVDTLGAVEDSFDVVGGETVTGDVSNNDDWHESMGDYVATVETEPTQGTLVLNTDGSFSYQPDAGFSGVDSFEYRVTNERGGFTTATVTLNGFSIDVQLVPVSLPSDSSLTDLPDGISSAPVGSSYFVEVWVQNRSGQLDGIVGGHVDIQYATDLLDALQLTSDHFGDIQSGTIDDAAGLIDDFGGGTLTEDQAIAPQWARLGYVEVIATGPGDAEYSLLPGALPFATFDEGNVSFDDVDLRDVATVSHTESWHLDFAVVREPSDTLDDGSVNQIPDSVSYVHEWEPFYVEVYLSNVTAVAGAETIAIDLSYDTSLTTAQQFKPGPGFEFPNGLPLLDDSSGMVSNIQVIATELGLGTQPVLLGHMLFSPTGSDDAAMGGEGAEALGAHDLGLSISASASVSGQSVDVVTGEMPATGMWAVPYDVDDSDQIDFADFAAFAKVFGASAENSETPFASWADFDGNGMIDFDDLAFFDANQGLRVDTHDLLSFSSAYPTPELALLPGTPSPELSQTTLETFSSFGPFHNGRDAYDVNNNGYTSALDALLIINALNSPTKSHPYFLDVSGDGLTTALDALRVINRLNESSFGQASATDVALSTSNASAEPLWTEDDNDSEDDDLIELLAADQRLF